MPPLTEFQKAFLKHVLISMDSIIDPETGGPLDWDALGTTEQSITNIFESNTFITTIKNQPDGVAGLDGNGKVGKGQTRYVDASISFVLGSGTSVVATGLAGFVRVPFACTITSVELLADQAGSIVVDIWKDTYANHPPTVADSITAAAKPTLSAASKYVDSTLTGWTTSISENDILAFKVDSAATVTLVTVVLRLERA